MTNIYLIKFFHIKIENLLNFNFYLFYKLFIYYLKITKLMIKNG